jgi:PhnB protein
MKIDLHLVFPGTCSDAFAFYEKVFGSKVIFAMTYGEAPDASQLPPGAENLVMNTAMPLGGITLMGCDAFPGVKSPIGGFHVSVSEPDEAECRRLFAALSSGGSVQMPIGLTFWSPLFGMCTDKFGVEWMIAIPGPEPSS